MQEGMPAKREVARRECVGAPTIIWIEVLHAGHSLHDFDCISEHGVVRAVRCSRRTPTARNRRRRGGKSPAKFPIRFCPRRRLPTSLQVKPPPRRPPPSSPGPSWPIIARSATPTSAGSRVGDKDGGAPIDVATDANGHFIIVRAATGRHISPRSRAPNKATRCSPARCLPMRRTCAW